MKIEFKDIILLQDDIDELEDAYSSVEYISKENIDSGETEYSEVTVNTLDLQTLEFEDWIQGWLEVGYKLEYSKLNLKFYIK